MRAWSRCAYTPMGAKLWSRHPFSKNSDFSDTSPIRREKTQRRCLPLKEGTRLRSAIGAIPLVTSDAGRPVEGEAQFSDHVLLAV